MRVDSECRPCLERLVLQASSLASSDALVVQALTTAGYELLERLFLPDGIAPVIATQCHRLIRSMSGNDDPYVSMKEWELREARRIYEELSSDLPEDLPSCLKLAAAGNTIDFFNAPDDILHDMRRPVEFFIDQVQLLEERVSAARHILYLADNTGECFFDLPAIAYLRKRARVTYAVKGGPSQNDLTEKDLALLGMDHEFGEVISTGTDAVGIDLPGSSPAFRTAFEQADIILAKGMGNYETLTEVPAAGRVFHCLKAKCRPVAAHLGVPLNSYVFCLR